MSQDVNPASVNATSDTELPAAVALADNLSNPTSPLVGASNLVWDGTNWRRMPAFQFGFGTVHKDAEYTSAQTGTALWTPASGKKFVVTGFAIATGGTTAGIFTLWQGASGDTTYNAGTDPAVYRGEFAPSATVKPGMTRALPTPYVSTTADHVLRVTTSAALTCYVQVDGFEI